MKDWRVLERANPKSGASRAKHAHRFPGLRFAPRRRDAKLHPGYDPLPILARGIEVLLQPLPAIGIALVDELELRGIGGRVQRVAGLEHERHGAGELLRLE